VYACPHCNKPGISMLRRAFLGPAIPATCNVCGGKVGVPYGRSFVAVAPFMAAILFGVFAPNPALLVLALVVGAVAMFALFFKFVPLVKK
jgi:hypothetical protein